MCKKLCKMGGGGAQKVSSCLGGGGGGAKKIHPLKGGAKSFTLS